MIYNNGKPLLMISSPQGLMIYQVCDLDKKILVPKNEDFLVETSGLEPLTPCMSSKYSNQLSYASDRW